MKLFLRGPYDLVLAGLEEAARRALEELMIRNQYEYQSDFARNYFGKGKAEGKAEDVVRLLELRQIQLAGEDRERILGCTDLDTLDRWFARAVTATTAADVLTN